MKNIKQLSIVSLLTLALVGCSNKTETVILADEELSATVTIIVDGEEHDSKTTSFEEGETVQDLTEEAFEVVAEDGFTSAIDGIEQSATDNKWWVFEVNEEMIMTGASETPVEDGDSIVWELTQF